MSTYAAIWPITNADRTRSELIREATTDLDLMLCEAGLVRAGEPEWTITGLQLKCRVDIEQWVDPLDGWENPYVPTSNIDRAALLAAQGHSAQEIATALQVTKRTAERYLTAALAGVAA